MSRLAQARIIALNTRVDPRGALTAVEGGLDIPFPIKRLFYMYHVAPAFERGGHAHPYTEHVLVAVAGHLKVDLSDEHTTQTHLLDDPGSGLYVPAMVWTRLYDFSTDAVCLAAASTHYDEPKVIREWDRYLERARGPRPRGSRRSSPRLAGG